MRSLKIGTSFFVFLAAATGALGLSAAPAQRGDPAAFIDQRQARMKGLGAAMKTLTGFSKGEATAADVRKAASVLTGARDMHRWWPRGTAKGVGDSKASPAIWIEQPRFQQRIAEFRKAGVMMDKAARSGDATRVRAQLPALGGSCKACHTAYQLKD